MEAFNIPALVRRSRRISQDKSMTSRQKAFDRVPRLGHRDDARDKVSVLCFLLAWQQGRGGDSGDAVERVLAR
jgi:hypothetical protein